MALSDFDLAADPNSGSKLSFKAALKQFIDAAQEVIGRDLECVRESL